MNIVIDKINVTFPKALHKRALFNGGEPKSTPMTCSTLYPDAKGPCYTFAKL